MTISLLVAGFAPQLAAQDADEAVVPVELAEVLGTNPDAPQELHPLDLEIRGSGPTAPEITGAYGGHVGGDRYVFKIVFADDYPDDDVVFHLYVDADDDLATGRQDSEAHQGTDIMYSFVNGQEDPRIHNPDVRASQAIPVRGIAHENAIYVSDDVHLNIEEGDAHFRMSLRSHLRSDSGDTWGSSWTYVTIPRDEDREPPALPIPVAEGFGWLTMPNFAELAYNVWEAEGTVRLLADDADIEEYIHRMSHDITGEGDPDESITWRSPVAGTYHIGLVMREDGNQLEGLDIRVGDEHAGTTVGKHGSREVMHYTLEAHELEEGTEIEVSTAEHSSPVTFHSVHLASAPPEIPALRIENLVAWHLPDEPGEAPGRIMVAWTTNRPTEAEVSYQSVAPADADETGVLEGRGLVNNHYVMLPQDLTGDAWELEIRCAEREQDLFETEQVSESFVVHRDRSAHLAEHGLPSEPGGENVQIPLTVRETSEFGRDAWPVRSGLPLPQGLLGDPAAVRLLDNAGTEIPVQTQVTTWWPDGISIQWLLLDFLAQTETGADASYTLEVNATPNVSPEQVVSVEAEEIALETALGLVSAPVTVDTGAMSWRLGEGGFTPFADVDAEGHRRAAVNDGEGGFELIDADGTLFTSAFEAPEEIVVEQAGPLRATLRIRGRMVNEDGEAHMRYLCRLHFHAGSPAVRTVFTLENDVIEPRMNRIESLQVRVPADLDGAAFSLGGDGETLEVASGDRLLQDEDFRFAVGDHEGERADGWLLARGDDGALAVAVRDFWELYPKGLSADDSGVTLELLPALPEDIYADASDAELTQWYFWADEGRYNLSTGVRITTDFAVDFAANGHADEPARYGAGSWWRNRIFAAATPEWYCATNTLDTLSPREEGQFEILERKLDEAFEGYLAAQERQREYGFMNYGDWFGERTWNWGNLEYDTHWGLAANYMRTGDIEMLETARLAAKHNADIDTLHYHEDPARVGFQYAHSIGHTGGFFDEDWMDMPAGYNRGALNRSGHLWAQGQFAVHALTGEERLLETGRKMAWMLAEHTTDFRYFNERTFGWPIIALIGAYHVDPNPFYLNGAKLMADAAVWTLHPDTNQWGARLNPRECRHDPFPEGPCWGSKPFMTGTGLRALSMYDQVQPREDVQRTLIRNSGWMWEVAYLPEDNGFFYSECPTHRSRGSQWTMGLVGAGLSYAATLDPEHPYLEHLKTAAEGYFYEAGPRGDGKGFGQSTTFLAALLSNLDTLGLTAYPERPQHGQMIFDLPEGPYEVGEVYEGSLVLRAPQDQSLHGTLRLRVDPHFAIEPTEVAVEADRGEKTRVPISLTLRRRPRLFAALPAVALEATLDGEAEMQPAQSALRGADGPVEDAIVIQAMDFVAEEGGTVQERDDKIGDLGTSFSHWNDTGHALTWRIQLPETGTYMLALRHCAPHEGERLVRVEDHGEFTVEMPDTGGYASNINDWVHTVVRDDDGEPIVFSLDAGEVTITAINTDDRGRNLDYVTLVPAD